MREMAAEAEVIRTKRSKAQQGNSNASGSRGAARAAEQPAADEQAVEPAVVDQREDDRARRLCDFFILSGRFSVAGFGRVKATTTHLNFALIGKTFKLANSTWGSEWSGGKPSACKIDGVCLSEGCFSHGQLYVAASRVGLPSHIRFAVDRESTGEYRTRNVVWRDALKYTARVT